MPGRRSFPGRLTLEEWQATPWRTRELLAQRAQCDLLGSFRFCANKRCRRGRTCVSDDPVNLCWSQVRRAQTKKGERLRTTKKAIWEFARVGRLWTVR